MKPHFVLASHALTATAVPRKTANTSLIRFVNLCFEMLLHNYLRTYLVSTATNVANVPYDDASAAKEGRKKNGTKCLGLALKLHVHPPLCTEYRMSHHGHNVTREHL